MDMMKRILTVTAAAVMACGLLTGCPDKASPEHSIDDPLPTDSVNTSTMDFSQQTAQSSEDAEEIGSFVVTLYPEYAPISCENFENLVKEGFYDGLYFHRVVDGFMAQGGDPALAGKEGVQTITGEFSENGWTQNTLSHTRGVVSMARSNDMNSASSQFFICYSDKYTSSLDGKYAAFGKVTEGMEVVDKFLTVERLANAKGETAVPNVPITIKKAEMIEPDAEGKHRARFDMTIG